MGRFVDFGTTTTCKSLYGSILVASVTSNGVRMTTKDTVKALLERLPDDCSLDDVLYHLYVVQAVARGDAR